MLKDYGVKTSWNSDLVRGMMMWGIKHLLFFKGNHEPRKEQPVFMLTDGCMWEKNKLDGKARSHAIEVVDVKTGAVRYIKGGSKIIFVDGEITETRSQEMYNKQP